MRQKFQFSVEYEPYLLRLFRIIDFILYTCATAKMFMLYYQSMLKISVSWRFIIMIKLFIHHSFLCHLFLRCCFWPRCGSCFFVNDLIVGFILGFCWLFRNSCFVLVVVKLLTGCCFTVVMRNCQRLVAAGFNRRCFDSLKT